MARDILRIQRKFNGLLSTGMACGAQRKALRLKKVASRPVLWINVNRSAQPMTKKAQMSRTRTSFVVGLKAHDEASWGRFYAKYRNLIYARALVTGLSPVEAEEAVQETFLTIFRLIDSFVYDRTKGRLSGLVFRTAGWRIGDQRRQIMRAQRQNVNPQVQCDQVAGDELSPSYVLEQKEALQMATNLYDAVMARIKARISDRQFQIYDLRVEKGWSVERICRMLAVSRQDVYNAAHRVPRYVQQEINKLRKTSTLRRSGGATHASQTLRRGPPGRQSPQDGDRHD